MRFALRFHHSLLPMLAVTAGSLLLAASSAHAQDAFSDGFTTSGPDANFTNVAGAWTSNGSTFSVTGDVQAFNFSVLTAPGATNYTDFSLSYDVSDASDAGFLLHGDSTADNALVFIVRPDDGDAYFVQRSQGGFGAVLGADTALNAPQGSSLQVAITGQGNNYTAVISTAADPAVAIDTVTLDGDPTAANYPMGGMGFYSYGFGAGLDQFGNLNVVPEPTTWMWLGAGGVGLLALARRRRAMAA